MPPDPSWRSRADRVRNLPLEPLVQLLGYEKDRFNRYRWRLKDSVLALHSDGSRFFDHFQGRGGGGAIDLVLHVRGGSFQQAVRFLERHHGLYPPSLPSPQLPPHADSLLLPQPDPSRWSFVRQHLLSERALPAAVLDQAHDARILYADARSNAVFLCRDAQGRPTAAELHGTRLRFKGLAKGSQLHSGGFWFPPPVCDPDGILLVESAIDALSAFACLRPPPGCLVISTAGTKFHLPPWLHPFLDRRLSCGYDNDPAGERAARSLRQLLPRLRRLRPGLGKDWNDHLRLSLTHPAGLPDRPTPDDHDLAAR